MMYGYEFIYIKDSYNPPAYQHVIEQDREMPMLAEAKPEPKLSLSIPVKNLASAGDNIEKKEKEGLGTKTDYSNKVAVYFKFNSAKLTKEEKRKLDSLSISEAILKGYASPEGPDLYNLNLSKRRISSVEKVLKAKGIKIDKEIAYGESKCKNVSKYKWKYCRKVEIEGK